MVDLRNRREYQKLYQREYRKKYPERIKNYHKRNYQKYRKEKLKKTRNYYWGNPEKYREIGREYWRKNKKRIMEKWHEYYLKNKEKYREKNKKYNRLMSPEKRSLYHSKHRREILSILGEICVKCGFIDIRALQIDHIHGGGSRARLRLDKHLYYKKILEEIKLGSKEYQILCANCNQIKKYTNKEHHF